MNIVGFVDSGEHYNNTQIVKFLENNENFNKSWRACSEHCKKSWICGDH